MTKSYLLAAGGSEGAVCAREKARMRVTAFSHAAGALQDQANNEAAASPDLTYAVA